MVVHVDDSGLPAEACVIVFLVTSLCCFERFFGLRHRMFQPSFRLSFEVPGGDAFEGIGFNASGSGFLESTSSKRAIEVYVCG